MERSHLVGDLSALEAAIAALEQGITVHDREGRIVVCNPAAARIAGLPLDEILGTRPPDYAHEVRDESGVRVTQEHSGVMRALRTGETELGKLVEVRPSDAEESRWLRVNYQPLIGGVEEDPWGVVASIVEVPPPSVGAVSSATGLARDVTEALDRHAPASTGSPEDDAAAKEIAMLRTEIMDLVDTLEDALKEG